MKSEFDKWFTGYLLHKTASALDRDILRWAKPVLEMGFKLQCLKDLEFKGSQVVLDGYLRSIGVQSTESEDDK